MLSDGRTDCRPLVHADTRWADACGMASVCDLRGDDSGVHFAAIPARNGRTCGDYICGADQYDQAGGGTRGIQQYGHLADCVGVPLRTGLHQDGTRAADRLLSHSEIRIEQPETSLYACPQRLHHCARNAVEHRTFGRYSLSDCTQPRFVGRSRVRQRAESVHSCSLYPSRWMRRLPLRF